MTRLCERLAILWPLNASDSPLRETRHCAKVDDTITARKHFLKPKQKSRMLCDQRGSGETCREAARIRNFRKGASEPRSHRGRPEGSQRSCVQSGSRHLQGGSKDTTQRVTGARRQGPKKPKSPKLRNPTPAGQRNAQKVEMSK